MLHLHRADRADLLVEALCDLVEKPLDDPLVAEVVSVPTRGVERWLAQRLSARLGAAPGHADGVCANFDFPFPGRLIGEAVASAAGIDLDADPWMAERSVWPLLEVVDQCVTEPWMASLAAHLGSGDRTADPEWRSRRFTTIRHIADLYDRYGVHRPDMLCAWATRADASAGADAGRGAGARADAYAGADAGAGAVAGAGAGGGADAYAGADTDGSARSLPPDTAWQAELWRRLRARIGSPSPAERLAGACARLASGDVSATLPPRLSVFGLTRLPASYVRVLRSLAVTRDVHLFLLHPSPILWARVAEAVGSGRSPIVRRADDDTALLPRNTLLASWGRDAREMQLVLAADTAGPAEGVPPQDHRIVDQPAGTLLRRIQADIRADRAPPGAPLPGQDDLRPVLGPDDDSVQVHACHGLARQVEVMRDAIVHLLNADPSLEARDVIVMCPDVETFAPLIHATFGAGDGSEVAADDPLAAGGAAGAAAGGFAGSASSEAPVSNLFGVGGSATGGGGRRVHVPDLRVRLADRSLRQTNPVLGVLAELLDLASARLTAAQVLDLAGREPVRQRFGFDDDDLARLDEWAKGTGVRWGLDAEHRAPFKLAWLEANTWRAGLDRVLLGVTMAEEGQRLVGGILPLDDVGSGDIDLAGRFAELIDRLHAAITAFNQPKPLAGWAEALAGAADELTATTEANRWQRVQLQGLLDDAVDEATDDGTINTAPLTLTEIRALLTDRLRGRPTRANFRTGHLTICTLVPMRSVPHRAVCLLGLDDGVFPRPAARDGDDIIGRDPHVGDRDARVEDRQLLLDAVLAATDHLVVTYAGRDERTNAERPPAVPVGELLDVIDRTVRTEATTAPDAEPARARVMVHHALQPFDPRNFTVGGLVRDRVWSFDPVALDGARSLSRDRLDVPAFLPGPLPSAATALVELDSVVRFVQHPVNAFLRQRLGVTLGERSDEVGDAVPIELDFLEQWSVGQRLLEARLAGVDAQAGIDAEGARGTLPPGALASPVLDRVQPVVDRLVRASESVAGAIGEVGSLEVNVWLPGGRSLVGTVAGVNGNLLRSVTYSRVGPKHRLAAWVRFLALTAAHPERCFEAVTIGRSRSGAARGSRVTVARLGAFAGDPETGRARALDHLGDLVALYDRGMREPLPLYCQTSAAYVDARGQDRNPESAALAAWESTWDYDKEDKELGHQLVLGGVRSLHQVLEVAPGEGETGAGWAADETSRFGRYARRLWDGLLAWEEVVDS